MMHHEFCTITALQIPYEQYANEIEPLYMQSPLQKQEFCSKWLKKYNRTNKPIAAACILKDVKKDIITSIKNEIDNRKYYNIERKKLVAEQYKIFKSHYDFYEDSNGNWWEYIHDNMRQVFTRERFNLIERHSCECHYHIIYKDCSERNFHSDDIITGHENAKNISYNNIVYMSISTGDYEMDTETGELNFDVSEDDQLEARDNYFAGIEIKYKTKWGLKQLAKLNQ